MAISLIGLEEDFTIMNMGSTGSFFPSYGSNGLDAFGEDMGNQKDNNYEKVHILWSKEQIAFP